MMTKEEILKLVHEIETPEIRAGETHRFKNIWIVVTERRMFCRQYYFSENSWYTTFLKDPGGYIKCDDTIIKVKGVIPKDLDEINPKVNDAYIEKYTKSPFPGIARKITGPNYMERTMELIPV